MGRTEKLLREHIRDTNSRVMEGDYLRPAFPIGVGRSISVQASKGHYCSPRIKPTSRIMEYSTVEVYIADYPFLQGFLHDHGDGVVAGQVPIARLADAIDGLVRHLIDNEEL